MATSKEKLPSDLQGQDSAGSVVFGTGLVVVGMGVGLGWLGWGISRHIWADIQSNAVRTKWEFWDFIFQPLMPVVCFLGSAAFVLGGLFFVGGSIYSLFADLSDEQRVWREKATALEITTTVRPGRIKLTKLRKGMSGKGHAGPSFSFYCDLVSVEGQDSMAAFALPCVERAAEFGPGKRSFRFRELPQSDSLINRLIEDSLSRGVPRESLENRPEKEIYAVTIPVSVKVDPAAPPRVMIAEAEGVRIWCSFRTEEEFRKLLRANA